MTIERKLVKTSGATAEAVYIEDVMSTFLYTGTGASQTITNGIDLATKGGLVWTKSRSNGVTNHLLFDTNRGTLNVLRSTSTAAQAAYTETLKSFTSSGFLLGSDVGGYNINEGGQTYASWTFRKQPKFFDIVTYTGNGVLGRQIPHALGSTPGMIIVKCTSGGSSDYPWMVYHRSLGATKYMQLESTSAASTWLYAWNNTEPTSSVFSVSSNTNTNQTGQTYVAYLFAHDAGGFGAAGTDSVVSCGSFTGAGATPVNVNLGWEAQYVIVKRTDALNAWFIFDNMRGMSETSDQYLTSNTSSAEGTDSPAWMTATATGFKATNWPAGGTYIYLAIRRGPMKTPTDATKVFAPVATSAATNSSMTVGFAADLVATGYRPGGLSYTLEDRLRGLAESDTSTSGKGLDTASTAAEYANYPNAYRIWNNTALIGANRGGASNIYHFFKRAPGFFDVVCYTGTASVTTRNHNLGVTPELMVIKGRSGTARKWYVYHKSLGNDGTYDYELVLNATDAQIAGGQWLVTNRPTSTTFTNNTFAGTNGAGETYVAYLFATCPGVSKVGSYTGSGTTKQIDCGFAAGARFVLIKRTDSTGDWYVWDTARGIVSGNDPYLLLNSTAAEVTNTDYIDPYSAGFEISSTAPAAINASGGTFIFLAVA